MGGEGAAHVLPVCAGSASWAGAGGQHWAAGGCGSGCAFFCGGDRGPGEGTDRGMTVRSKTLRLEAAVMAKDAQDARETRDTWDVGVRAVTRSVSGQMGRGRIGPAPDMQADGRWLLAGWDQGGRCYQSFR